MILPRIAPVHQLPFWRNFLVNLRTLTKMGPLSDRHFFLLIVLITIEAIVFYRVMIVELAPFYPTQFDQLSYYLETYSLIDRVQTAGWWTMIDEFILPRSAVSVQFTTQGALLGILFGADRTVIISLNFIYFVALQLVLFYSVRGRTNRWDPAWFSVAVLLSCATIFIVPGGVYDYRVDFSALCLYGIWTCLLIRNRAFSSTNDLSPFSPCFGNHFL